ncbi:MAG: hypothetical protein BEN19_00150 [Epulopiscium sp. Nuni2H_MBin003]|nr:MAG: hypothetical protein BEN19_00150 [Epulopiscium sp. Nuni2H_MBin003]
MKQLKEPLNILFFEDIHNLAKFRDAYEKNELDKYEHTVIKITTEQELAEISDRLGKKYANYSTFLSVKKNGEEYTSRSILEIIGMITDYSSYDHMTIGYELRRSNYDIYIVK